MVRMRFGMMLRFGCLSLWYGLFDDLFVAYVVAGCWSLRGFSFDCCLIVLLV